ASELARHRSGAGEVPRRREPGRDRISPRDGRGLLEQGGALMAHDALLECTALSARYGRIAVCRDMNFTLNRGEVLAVLGPNGAGKTSMLGSVSGIVSGEGSVRLLGQEINQLPEDRRPKHGLR